MIKIISVKQSQRDLKKFHQLAMDVSQRPQALSAERFRQLKKALFATNFLGKQQLLLALEGEKPVARLVARIAPQLQDEQSQPYGLIGFFECLEHPVAVKSLFDEAMKWFDEQGIATVIGPMTSSAWFSHRFNLGPSEAPLYLFEPRNPSYYPQLWEDYGFSSAADYYSRHVDNLEATLEQLKPHHDKCLRQGIRFRALKPHRMGKELNLAHLIANQAFQGSPYFSEIRETVFSLQYTQLKSWVKKRLVHFAFDKDGQAVAFLYALPDYEKLNLLSKLAPGKLAKIDTINLYTIAVVPEYQHMGIGSALTYLCYRNALELGFHQANFCVMKEGNPIDKINHTKGEVFRRYRLYRLKLEA